MLDVVWRNSRHEMSLTLHSLDSYMSKNIALPSLQWQKHKITLSNRDRVTHIGVTLTLLPIMACRLFDAKPLYKPLLLYIVNWTLGNKRKWHLNQNEHFSYKKMHSKISSVKWWPFCLGLNTLMATIFPPRCKFTPYAKFNVAFGELSPINLKNRNGVKHFPSPNRLASI